MSRKKVIRVSGIQGKKFSRFPFFANEQVKKELLISLSKHKSKGPGERRGIVIDLRKKSGDAAPSDTVNL